MPVRRSLSAAARIVSWKTRVLGDDRLEVVAADERREPVAARPELVELLPP